MTPQAVQPVPEGFTTVTPYLVVSEADRMIAFLEKAFGGKVVHATRIGGVVRHAVVQVGTAKLMLGQASEGWKPQPAMFYLYVEDCDAVHAKAVAVGGTVISAPANQPYGDRNGAVSDFDGNQWYIGSHVEDLSDEELQARMSTRA